MHVPLRTCIVTRRKAPKHELMRLVDDNSHKRIVLDMTGKAVGRGANMSKELEVFEEAVKKNILSKVFRRKVTEVELEQLRSEVEMYLTREKLKDTKGNITVRVNAGKVKLK